MAGWPKELWPTCETCNRKVERLTITKCWVPDGYWIVLECHGARETYQIDELTMWAVIGVGGPGRNGIDNIKLEAGTAFGQKKILPP